MSQLHTFLNVLQNSELVKIKRGRLIGKEKRVFDFLLSYRHKELPHLEQIVSELDVSGNHYYKICSVIIDKFYELLVPEKGYELLYLLNRKGLYNLFTHELLMQEKALKSPNVKPEYIQKFYFNAFNLLQRVSAIDLNEDLILSYGNKYLHSIVVKREDDQYYVRCSFLATRLFLLKATKKDIEVSASILKELQKIEKLLQNSNHFSARFQLNRAMSVYYNHSVNEPEEVIKYINNNIDLMNSKPSAFKEEELPLAKCKIAEMEYNRSHFEVSYKMYSAIFEEYAEQLTNDFYHHAKFVQLALILNKFDKAEELIGQHFLVFLESKQPGTGTMASLLYAKLYLFKDPLNGANKYIQSAKKLINKSFYLQYEFEVRILENIYLILSDDIKSAKSALKKNLKFMNSKGFTLKNSEMIFVFILLQEFLKPDYKVKGLNKRMQYRYDLLQMSYAAVYGKLLAIVKGHLK